jgi:hypothetical protein
MMANIGVTRGELEDGAVMISSAVSRRARYFALEKKTKQIQRKKKEKSVRDGVTCL